MSKYKTFASYKVFVDGRVENAYIAVDPETLRPTNESWIFLARHNAGAESFRLAKKPTRVSRPKE